MWDNENKRVKVCKKGGCILCLAQNKTFVLCKDGVYFVIIPAFFLFAD